MPRGVVCILVSKRVDGRLMKFQMYEVVRLKRATEGLHEGAEGTIVTAYDSPREGYTVEFPELKAEMPILTLGPEDLESVA